MGENHLLAAVGDVVAGEARLRPENPAVEHGASADAVRSRNPTEELLPTAALHREGHFEALLQKEHDCRGDSRGHRQECGAVLAAGERYFGMVDGVPSAYNRCDQTVSGVAVALYDAPYGAAGVPCAVAPYSVAVPDGEPVAGERADAGRKRYDYDGFRMIAHPSHDLASAYKKANEKVQQR